MATDFVQTDSEADPSAIAALCSGGVNSFNTESNQCDPEGDPGSTARIVTLTSVLRNIVWMEIVNIDAYDGASGDWTWRLNVTIAADDGILDAVYICHVDSSYSVKNTIGSSTGLGISVTTTGVKSGTINQASPVSVAAGDRIVLIFAFRFQGPIGPQTIRYVPDQNITGPGEIVRILGGQWVAGEVYVPGFQAGQVAE